MHDPALLRGVTEQTVDTPRLRTRMLAGGAEGGEPVFFVHGNVSSSRFFEETLAALPGETAAGNVGNTGYHGIAPDLRGFGGSETRPVDATRGLGDFADDLYALVGSLGFGGAGYTWSAGRRVAP